MEVLYIEVAAFWSHVQRFRIQQDHTRYLDFDGSKISPPYNCILWWFSCHWVWTFAATTTNMVQPLLDLLGWKHATTGRKSVDFSDTMQVLGVAFHLQNFWNKQVTVANRPSRIQRSLEMLESYAAKGTVSAPEAATVHGLLNYASGFVVGRCLKPAARQFASLQSGSSDTELISRLCNDTCRIINRMRPREFRFLSSDRPAVIYTDCEYENGNGTWGAVVIIPQLGINAIHWGTIPPVLMEHWTSIGPQAENLSHWVGWGFVCEVFLSQWTFQFFSTVLRWQRGCTFLLDHRIQPFTVHVQHLSCSVLSRSRISFHFIVWKVASESNIADLPSRSKLKECQAISGGNLAGDIWLPETMILKVTRKWTSLHVGKKTGVTGDMTCWPETVTRHLTCVCAVSPPTQLR